MLKQGARDHVHGTYEAAQENASGAGSRPGVIRVAILALMVSLSGCSHFSGVHLPSFHVPWQHGPVPQPEVHELDEVGAGGAPAAFPQYWFRNTLVVNLQGVSGSGAVVLTPREGTTWPVRIAFKVMPGSIGELEVRGAQRIVLPITPAGAQPILLELSPGIYVPKTQQLTVGWAKGVVPP
jgi:hypothetical protein